MAITIIEAKNFSKRSELEAKVATMIGLTPDRKEDYQIQGTEEELARLQLSESTVYYGILCIATDNENKQDEEAPPRPDRGEVKPSGLNGNVKKIKND